MGTEQELSGTGGGAQVAQRYDRNQARRWAVARVAEQRPGIVARGPSRVVVPVTERTSKYGKCSEYSSDCSERSKCREYSKYSVAPVAKRAAR
eukprot:scaffold58602_cov62-Phaeocystis_antarctica.AAC.4